MGSTDSQVARRRRSAAGCCCSPPSVAGLIPVTALLAAAILGGALGFLLWNWSPAQIFLGDIGSVPLGYLTGFLLIDVAARGHWKIALILPLYFLADATITLLHRLLQGERIWQPHRRHYYQQAVRRGLGHAAVVRRVIAANLLLIGCGWAAENGWGGLALGVAVRDCDGVAGDTRSRPLKDTRRLVPDRSRTYTQPMSSPPQKLRRALISVSDKSGIVAFAGALATRGVALVSTGGTARTLEAAGLRVTEVAAVTGMAEFLDGRVKTLHPKIHGGLLARRDRPEHLAALAERGIDAIDLLVCNLYPFAENVAAGAGRENCIENIDIGGVALIRAAAKNHDAVTVVTDPADYDRVLAELEAGDGAVGPGLRRRLAGKAYAATAAYDAAIAEWMSREGGETFPETLIATGRLSQLLRYGENPHQAGAFYRTGERRPGVATARQLQGKELSYNNYADADAAFELVAEFAPPAVAIVKHANPCGVAIGANLREAWDKALACDRQSAFGGVVAINRPLDSATAEAIVKSLSRSSSSPRRLRKPRQY